MERKIDESIAKRFSTATAVLMTRDFSTPLGANKRSLAFAAGPATSEADRVVPTPQREFDIVGLGFAPGREWKGPIQIFVQEFRDGKERTHTGCRLWSAPTGGPLYILTEDPDLSFSFDGISLVWLKGQPEDPDGGAKRAMERLRAAAKLVPKDVETRTMM